MADERGNSRVKEEQKRWNGRIRGWWRTWHKQVLCVAAGLALYAVSLVTERAGTRITEGYLMRNGYGDGPVVYDLVVEGMTERPFDCQVEIQAVRYETEEAEKVFEQIIQSLPERIKGENPSVLEVKTDLTLPAEFREYGISVSWRSDNPEVMDSFGQIRIQDCPEEGAAVCLTAKLTDGIHSREAPVEVRVYPGDVSDEQKLAALLKARIQEEDLRSYARKEVKLPKEWDGQALHYRQKAEKEYRLFPLFGVAAAVLLYAREKKQVQEEQKKRDQKLLLDYADVVYQLMVFTGAGLTVGRAWERIVLNYEERRREGRRSKRPVYEEMAETYGQMQCGMPEGKAIADFGKRCRLQPYLKLSTLLEQNRRTGTKDLQQILEQEMTLAWEQQTNVARRMGEEAGTKLLLPLFLMLLVVMTVIMVPAMMSMV